MTPILSFDAQDRIRREHEDLTQRLKSALDAMAVQHPGLTRLSANTAQVRDRVIAWAIELFQSELTEYDEMHLDAGSYAECVRALAKRIYAAGSPPIVHQCLVSLASLRDDAEFGSLLWEALEARANAAIEAMKSQGAATEAHSTRHGAKEIIANYCGKNISRRELADRAEVDLSVVYAIARGEKRCGEDALVRLAKVLGCEVDDLRPKGRKASLL